jgi:hypothetical protein
MGKNGVLLRIELNGNIETKGFYQQKGKEASVAYDKLKQLTHVKRLLGCKVAGLQGCKVSGLQGCDCTRDSIPTL